ncbi:hypothetical protein DFQ27_001395, partial [Actinomortierella ambigua]
KKNKKPVPSMPDPPPPPTPEAIMEGLYQELQKLRNDFGTLQQLTNQSMLDNSNLRTQIKESEGRHTAELAAFKESSNASMQAQLESAKAKQVIDVVNKSPYKSDAPLGLSDDLPLVEATGRLPYMLPPHVPFFNGKEGVGTWAMAVNELWVRVPFKNLSYLGRLRTLSAITLGRPAEVVASETRDVVKNGYVGREWNQFWVTLVNAFGGEQNNMVLRTMLSTMRIRPGETLAAYLGRFEDEASRHVPPLTPREKFSLFCQAGPSHMVDKIITHAVSEDWTSLRNVVLAQSHTDLLRASTRQARGESSSSSNKGHKDHKNNHAKPAQQVHKQPYKSQEADFQ